jgi:hypothetical protein
MSDTYDTRILSIAASVMIGMSLANLRISKTSSLVSLAALPVSPQFRPCFTVSRLLSPTLPLMTWSGLIQIRFPQVWRDTVDGGKSP